jgi:hypothetical protein
VMVNSENMLDGSSCDVDSPIVSANP